MPHCLCCGCTLEDPDETRDGWCRACAGVVLHAVLSLRDGPLEVVGARVRALQDWGAEAIAQAIIGEVPFDWGDGGS